MSTEKNNPLISVLMTAYNREKFIAEAIDSVLQSTYENFELIIVDDGSKDDTIKIAKEYEARDQRVKLYLNEKNLGDYPNRNKAASYARGEFLMYVDSDDSIEADAMEYIVKNFALFPQADFSLLYYKKDITAPVMLTPEQSLQKHFFEKSFLNIGPGGTIVRRSVFEKLGCFPEKYGPANDLYYDLKMASNTNLLLLPYIYLNYRIHDGQEANNKYSYLYNNHRVIVDVFNEQAIPLSAKDKRRVIRKKTGENLYSLLYYLKKTGNLKKAAKALHMSGISIRNVFGRLK